MPKNPSLTKQISDALGTEDKREQLQKISNLSQLASVPPLAITVLFTATGVNLTYTSPVQVRPQDLKAVLNQAVDEITTAMVKAEYEKSAGLSVKEQEQVYDYLRKNPTETYQMKDGGVLTIDDVPDLAPDDVE